MPDLGSSMRAVVKKVVRAGRIDARTVDEIVKDVQRALLQADVNVELVMQLSSQIRERALKEKPPAGANPREHVIKIIYETLVEIIGKGVDVPLKEQKILMVGLHGSGKTTTVAKLARFFQRKGLKPAVICADTYRPGAYAQLKQLCDQIGVPCYGDGKAPLKIVKEGLKTLKDDVIIVDTAGRHALEKDLIKEMKDLVRILKPDQKILVLDAAIGQVAGAQAKAFNDAVSITGVILTKMDGTAKGGGALSAVAETGAPIAFMGTGETPEDLERFDPDGYISRLLGMGDIKSLIERAEESLGKGELDVKAMLRGKFTLEDMYKQLEAINKLGPLKQVMQMVPLGMEVPDDAYEVTKDRLKKYKVIMDSMTDEELREPKIIGSSRIKRIAIGSGTATEDVRGLLKYHKMMQTAMKGLRGGKFPMRKMMKRFKI